MNLLSILHSALRIPRFQDALRRFRGVKVATSLLGAPRATRRGLEEVPKRCFSVVAPPVFGFLKSIPRSAFRFLSFQGVEFANDRETIVVFGNEVSLTEDGWAQLAVYGDWPGKAMQVQENGQVKTFDAVQRFDRQAAGLMVTAFKSPLGTVKRFFRGCPIYLGHPDAPVGGGRYPDKSTKGMIADLQAREDGLWCQPVFSNEGIELLEKKRMYFSGRWSSDEVGLENGKKIFRPDELKSAGLVEKPNLPVQWINEREDQPNKTNMTIQQLIALLAKLGVTFANEADATEENLATKLDEIATRNTTLQTSFSNEQTAHNLVKTEFTRVQGELTTAKTSFANERKDRIKDLLDGAITAGCLTAAERSTWETRLTNEATFANERAELAKLKPKIKTQSVTLDMGGRKVEIANAAERQATVTELVAKEQKDNSLSYDAAYARVQTAYPQLFAAMKQPEIK